jgi:DNA topoisomerase VI subunit A
MISYLTQTIGNRQSVQFRQVYYTAVEHLSRNQTKNLVEEIALNCNLHPTSLGIEAEADGLLWHGEHLQLKLCRIDNVFITAKQKAESQFRKKFKIYRPGISGHPVPSQLLDLSVDSAVQGSGTRARAVIVVEHENIGIAMQAMKDTFKDVIVLMVSLVLSTTKSKG